MAFSTQNRTSPFQLLFCIFANFICFGVCYYCKLPFRLEHVGTLYAALNIGIGAGIFAAVVSQLIYALFYFGFSNILFLIPILILILFIHFAKDCDWMETVVGSLGSMSMACAFVSILSILISLLIGRNFMRGTLFLDLYDTLARYLAYGRLKDSVIAVGGYAVLNTALTWIVASLAYRLTPKSVGFGFRER